MDLLTPTDARELHTKLQSGNDFSTWFSKRVEKYKFVENQDFGIVLQTQGKSGRGRPAKDYAITLEMAKRLSMVEETEIGKKAQLYFIESERISYEAKQSSADIDDRFGCFRSRWREGILLRHILRRERSDIRCHPVIQQRPEAQLTLLLTQRSRRALGRDTGGCSPVDVSLQRYLRLGD